MMLPELMPIPAFARLLQVSQMLTPSDPQMAAGSSSDGSFYYGPGLDGGNFV